MYSTLDAIDLVAKDDGLERYILTDHREAAEIEAEPELSVLFALTRVLKARTYGDAHGAQSTVIYACLSDDPPAFLREVIAAAGGELEHGSEHQRVPPATTEATPAELADRAYRGLARRVQARTGLTDMAATLHALEAEVLIDPPDREDDEITYWTRVAELAAVTGELLRARDGGGRWVDCDSADIPFGFLDARDHIMLPTNRAARFIADGEDESMFRLLEIADEATSDDADRVLLPTLRSRTEATRENMVYRPLLDDAPPDVEVPVIAYGTDSPNTFGIMQRKGDEDLEALHAEALANLASQEVTVEELELEDVTVLAVTGSFFATEKLLDRAFMQSLHDRLGEEALLASVPRRGLMFVTAGTGGDPHRTAAVLATITHHEATTTRSISTGVLIVTEGQVAGYVQIEPEDGDSDPTDEPPPRKKPGFLKRLLGRS